MAAQQATDARTQNREIERLGEVVVRSRGEALQYIVRMTTRREHQSGNELPGTAQLGHHLEAVLARQHHIKHHYVVGGGPGH